MRTAYLAYAFGLAVGAFTVYKAMKNEFEEKLEKAKDDINADWALALRRDQDKRSEFELNTLAMIERRDSEQAEFKAEYDELRDEYDKLVDEYFKLDDENERLRQELKGAGLVDGIFLNGEEVEAEDYSESYSEDELAEGDPVRVISPSEYGNEAFAHEKVTYHHYCVDGVTIDDYGLIVEDDSAVDIAVKDCGIPDVGIRTRYVRDFNHGIDIRVEVIAESYEESVAGDGRRPEDLRMIDE